MWSDILKASNRQRIKGSIFRRLLLEHVEETDYQDKYIIQEVIDSIFDEYKRLHVENSTITWSKNEISQKLNRFIGKYFPEGYKRNIRFKRMDKLDQRDILIKGSGRHKVKGSIFKRVLLEHVEETGYQNEYIIEEVVDNIFDEYKRLHGIQFPDKKPGWVIPENVKGKLTRFISGYFPEGYKRIDPGSRTKIMVKLNQSNKLEKRNLGTKSNKVIGSIFKKILLEHVEKTGYEDEYIIDDVIDSIFDEYIELHTQHLNPEGERRKLSIVPSTVKDKMTGFFGRSFPEGYKRIQGKGKHSSKMVKLKPNVLKHRSKIYGDVLREVLKEYVEKTGYQDKYIIDDVVDDILESYITKHKNKTREKMNDGLINSVSYHGGSSHLIGNIETVKFKVNFFFTRYFPDGYERIQGDSRRPSRMKKLNTTTNIDKLRTDSGDRLKLKDWENFKSRLRRGLRAEVPLDKNGRRTNVRLVDGEAVGNKNSLNISFRDKSLGRKYVHIMFIEEEGDYYFTNVEGDIQLNDNETFENESELRNRIIDMVVELLDRQFNEVDLREKEEGELTEEENIRQLEAANPNSRWDRKRAMLVPREKEIEPESRDLTISEAAKLGNKMREAEEKKNKLLAAQKRLKAKSGKLEPVRGKRGRRDVS